MYGLVQSMFIETFENFADLQDWKCMKPHT